MSIQSRYYPNLYKDSVSLMTLSAQLMAVSGVESASVVMASASNVENLAGAGLGSFAIRPNDLIVAVSGSDEGCAEALARSDELLKQSPASSGSEGVRTAQPITSLQMAVREDAAHNFALVSVPGDYAAAEAMKALRLGMDVMIFSDNVPPESELALKLFAQQENLMVMGPDCGTAIVNGIPLGFAHRIRRGPIGVVGASGTGIQEITVRIHQRGSGVSQALGTGGNDLSSAIGGISMLHGLSALDEDPDTNVIVLVSKPPAPEVAAAVLAAAAASTKPVVVIFLGADSASIPHNGVYFARYLAEAADMAVALASGKAPQQNPIGLTDDVHRKLMVESQAMASSQRFVRGIFSGGTFCFEAQLIHASAGIAAFSNNPAAANRKLEKGGKSLENSILDMGDDEFTQGRPHPMIDPSLRDNRIREEAGDPTTAVILFDVVLGYGSAARPTEGLVGVIRTAQAKARAGGRKVAFIGHVCGTDDDPQNYAAIVESLHSTGVLVASSNAEAAVWSAAIISSRMEAAP